MRMRAALAGGSICAFAFCCGARPACGSATGLNSIPTTDLVPLQSWIAYVQNSNASFRSPAFYGAPDTIFASQVALSSHAEAGLDWYAPPGLSRSTLVFNFKDLLMSEDVYRPGMAVGVWNLANRLAPSYYVTFSKTLNFREELRERFRAHHRRNRKLLGRRVHVGLLVGERGDLEPFLGTDLQLNESTVFQADWINGDGYAVTAGVAYVLPDQRTVLNPVLLYSNTTHRLDGFYLNISHQFSL